MNRIYEIIKGKELVYHDYKGCIVGYVSDKFILATVDKTEKGFRKFDRQDTPFIEGDYKDSKFKYVWLDENDVYKQHPELKNAVI